MGGLIALAIAVGFAVLSDGSPDGTLEDLSGAPPKLERFEVGSGANAAEVVRPEGVTGPSPGIIFLHGWGELGVGKYRAWIDHLARRGNVVIVPRYQTSSASPPGTVLSAALSGVRAAHRTAPIAADTLVVVGHSAGAALAADYAATAATDETLPSPLGIYAVYPGRAILGYPTGIPVVDPGMIPRRTRIFAMGGTRDTVVGTAPALELLSSATSVPPEHKTYVEITGRRLSAHYAPLESNRRVRRTFWEPLDELIEKVR
jgi:acetyl esterase/lipase